jgi:membrane protein
MAASKDKPPSIQPGADSDRNNPQSQAKAAGETGRGREAAKPTDIPARGWMDILKRTFQQLGEDNLSIVAAGVGFYAFTAMVPALAAMIATYALVADPGTVSQNIESLARVIPEQARPLLHDQLTRLSTDNEAAGWSAVLGIGIALFGAMKAVTALITGLNIAYDETERRGFVKLNLVAIALTFAAIFGAVLVIGLLTVIPPVLGMLAGGKMLQSVFEVLRWPLLAVLFVFGLSVVYRYAPCRDKPRWSWVSWGAGVASLLWLLGSGAFSLYVSKFGGYESTYGSLGAVVIFLTWLFLTAYVILLGAELDAEMERQTKRDTTAGPEKPMGQRGAYSADTLGEARGPGKDKK